MLGKMTIPLLMMILCLQFFYDYCDDNYAMKNNFNHPYETCHNYYSPTKHHLYNIQLVYHVQVLYDSPTLNATNNKDFSYVESNNNTFMHVNHEKND